VLALLNPWSLLVCLAAVGGLLVYTPLKRRWWAGPAANAWVVALLPVAGWLVASGGRLGDLWEEPRVLAAALMSFAAYGNFVLAGYLKDVRADRATGYQTFPVRFGWPRTLWASDLWALAALALGAWAVYLCGGTSGSGYLPVMFLVGAAVISLYAQVALHRTHREEDVHRPLIAVVRVFLLLEAAVVCAARPGWWPLAAGLYGAFELLVRVRPDRGQV
jgi:4-hydroxybenzoate polyprenyltransferase